LGFALFVNLQIEPNTLSFIRIIQTLVCFFAFYLDKVADNPGLLFLPLWSPINHCFKLYYSPKLAGIILQ